ncbi:MAG: hemolysin family protein [Candidatus Caldatribacterium sp.]|uniref:hemolysin family protein n=1 Tax=Candidatus Caldatribacterium sp. TaxID=2282143 RepID=UPI00299C6FF9|nr:hemolysin family protein [Candidatus Caldatribacterium sp.]MCX7730294.1 hemolysin family protein [Candidatus Caldatribacterium sp.]MDW8082042.1 hemolysin family protein [Candidatus Calescibacterium sp.]
MEYLGTILLIFLLVGINAFFAASEIALISTRRSHLHLTKGKASEKQFEALRRLLESPSEFLATIQIGVTMAGFFASATGAISLARNLGRRLEGSGFPILAVFGEEIAVILVTVLISFVTLVLGELVPKRIAMAHPERLALLSSRLILFLSRVLRPVVVALSASTDFVSRLFGVTQEVASSLTDEELKLFISEQRTLPLEERRLLSEVFEFGDTLAYEVMTPRTDMVCIEENATLGEALELSLKSHFSRLPVYREDIDNIIGFVHIKDILPALREGNLDRPVRDIIRPIHVVPTTKKVVELLRELQQRRIHMAIVLDEYGGTAGLVTIEDLLEELVGEIRDEHDREAPPYRKLSDHEYLVDASLPIETVNEFLGVAIPESEESETLGGLVMELLGKVPEEGETVHVDGYAIRVERMRGRRIATVRLTVIGRGEGENGKAHYSP